MTETSQSTQTEPRGIARILPILQWAPAYERRSLKSESLSKFEWALDLLDVQ